MDGVDNTAIQEKHPKLPIFLGARLRDADTLAALDIGTLNLTATRAISVSMMGYRWEARSKLALGGLQRPVNALFG